MSEEREIKLERFACFLFINMSLEIFHFYASQSNVIGELQLNLSKKEIHVNDKQNDFFLRRLSEHSTDNLSSIVVKIVITNCSPASMV